MQNCTIVIPTYNRSKFLKKLLKYIVQNEFDFPILVVDGSTKDQEIENNKKLIKELNLNYNSVITHIIDDSFIMNRIHNSMSKIETKYCKMNMDDDFFSKEFIEDSIDSFEKNSDYSVITGYSISFHQETDNISKSKYYLGDQEINLQDDLIERFEFSKFNWHPFGVYKKDLFEMIFKEYVDIVKNTETETNFNQAMLFRFFSYNMKLHSLIQGKVKLLKRCMNLTIYHENNWGKQHGLIKPLETFYSKDFLNYLIKLKNSIASRYKFQDDTINQILHLVVFNDKHISKYSLKEKNFFKKIFNLSLKKLYENLLVKFKTYFPNKQLLTEDGKKIIKYLKRQI